MKALKLLFHFIVAGLIIILLNQSIPIGSISIPPPAPFFSPFTGFWKQAESVKTSNTERNIFLKGLTEEVKVWHDTHRIPHIFASNDLDAIRAQGYIEASERLWQMDISSRSSAGRLSEIMGPAFLKRDQLQRRKGIGMAAERAVESWSKNPGISKFLNAYVEGVNAYIEHLSPRDFPIEFKLLQYKPEKWSLLNIALLNKSMAQELCFIGPDIHMNNTRIFLGDTLFQSLFPDYLDNDEPVVADQTFWKAKEHGDPITDDELHLDRIIYNDLIKLPPRGIGSNNWAVAGAKTNTGSPILCNDPHLGLTLPSVWFEVHVHTPDWNSYGVSFPGAPGIILGFNEKIAWGFTNASQDVLDWFRIDWVDTAKTQYMYNGNIEQVGYRIENISLKDGSVVRDSVKYSLWGPVTYENDEYGLAMRWIAHDAPDSEDILSFYKMSKASEWNTFSKAAEQFVSPAQNIIFASVSGDIGIRVSGKFPERSGQQGRFIRSGQLCASEWDCFIPREFIPVEYNPSKNYVASANQRSVSENYPFYVTGNFEYYRNRYINHRLDSMEQIDMQAMQAMQNEKFSLKASEYLPHLIRLLLIADPTKQSDPMLKVIQQWNYVYAEKSRAAAFFDLWFNALQNLSYDELIAVRDSFNIKLPDEQIWLRLALKNPDHIIFDIKGTSKKENASDLVLLSFLQAETEADSLVKLYGHCTWESVNKPSIPHLGRIDAFGKKPLQATGSKDAINALHHSFGPSWRMIVSLEAETKAWGILPGGQSGNPGSFYYDSSLEDWTKGQYRKLIFTRDTIELNEEAMFKLRFKP